MSLPRIRFRVLPRFPVDLVAGTGIDIDNTLGVYTVSLTSTGAARERLTADRTYFVLKTGSDSNTGLLNTAGGAFLTIQKAVNVCRADIDAAGLKVKVKVGPGTWTEAVQLFPVLGVHPGGWATSELLLEGDTTTPSNCLWQTTGGNCITSVGCHIQWRIQGFKFSTITSGKCIVADLGSNIALGFNEFGACASIHTQCLNRSSLEFVENYTINGSAAAGYHWYADELSQYIFQPLAVTLVGTPAFAGFAASQHHSSISCAAVSFSGSATGPRYFVYTMGMIDTSGGGANFLPGNVAGTNSGAGAQYI